MAEEYWECRIGPIDRSKVPNNGDYPMRQAVKAAFAKLIGEHAEICSSGWGLTQDESEAIDKIRNARFLNSHKPQKET